jgi:hypothetical protein
MKVCVTVLLIVLVAAPVLAGPGGCADCRDDELCPE